MLVDYILGVAGRNAAHARVRTDQHVGRTAALTAIADRWARLDPARYPRVHHAAGHLAEHDDREQFVTGVDLILTGIDTTHRHHRCAGDH